MKTTVKISGMSCAHCVNHVTEALTEVNGITAVFVSLENGTAEITCEDGVTMPQIKEAIEEAGYELDE